MDFLETSLPLLAFWDVNGDLGLHKDSEKSGDDHRTVLPIVVHWSPPLRKPQDPTSADAEFSPARQRAIECASEDECVYLAVGCRWRWLPLWKQTGYIGSSGSGVNRLKKKGNDYGLHRMNRKGRIVEMYVGKIQSRLTRKEVVTAFGKTVFDYEVGEHLLIGLFARCRKCIPEWLSKRIFLPFNERRRVKRRSALLINRFDDGVRPKGFPDVIAYDDNEGNAICWWIKEGRKYSGRYWGRAYSLKPAENANEE